MYLLPRLYGTLIVGHNERTRFTRVVIIRSVPTMARSENMLEKMLSHAAGHDVKIMFKEERVGARLRE